VEALSFMKQWKYAAFQTALGPWLVASSSRGLVYLGLQGARSRAALEALRQRVDPELELREDPRELRAAQRQLEEYARGERRAFELELDAVGTEFDRQVWRELRRIPYGSTRSYGEIARRLGNPGLARAVGGANGRNPLPVIVPCHRVLASTGLGGYSGGLETKRQLLLLEGVKTP
jgi:methylated-DNA-[protein]-cysteine S-methyltransferase